jgi:hypothetical protein
MKDMNHPAEAASCTAEGNDEQAHDKATLLVVSDVELGCYSFVEGDEEVFACDDMHASTYWVFPLLRGEWRPPFFKHIGEEMQLGSVYIDGSDTRWVSLASAHDLLLEQAKVIGATRIIYRQRWEEIAIDRCTPSGVHETGVFLNATVVLVRKRQSATSLDNSKPEEVQSE